MKKSLQVIVWLLLAAAVVGILWVNAKRGEEASVSKSGKPVVKIGIVLPMTGNNAFLGEGARDAIQMRLKELGDKSKYEYKIIFEDDGLVLSRTAMAIRKCKSVDHVNVLMTMWGYADDMLVPMLKDSGILHLSPHCWSTLPQSFNWYVGDSQEQHAKKLVALLKACGYKRVAWLYAAQRTTVQYQKELDALLQGTDIKIVESLMISDDARDFRTWLLKAKEAKAEVILDMNNMPMNEILHKQKRELAIDIPIVNLSGTAIQIRPELTNGEAFVYSHTPTDEFNKRYALLYNRECKYPVGNFYNAMSLLIKAYESCDGKAVPTLAQVTASMSQIKEFEGSTGILSLTEPRRFEVPVVYYVFENGAPRMLPLEELVKLKTQK